VFMNKFNSNLEKARDNMDKVRFLEFWCNYFKVRINERFINTTLLLYFTKKTWS
jgi:hypothetical protein